MKVCHTTCCIAGYFPDLIPTPAPLGAGVALPERPKPTASSRHEGGAYANAVATAPCARERRGLPAIEPEESSENF
jgi:hypothetical protein